MNEREKLFQSNAKITDRLIDLRDQLMEAHSPEVVRSLRERIDTLQDILFYNQEQIDLIDGVLDN